MQYKNYIKQIKINNYIKNNIQSTNFNFSISLIFFSIQVCKFIICIVSKIFSILSS